MDPIIDFLGFNIVLEYDNDLLTIPTTHFDELLMHFGTVKVTWKHIFETKFSLETRLLSRKHKPS